MLDVDLAAMRQLVEGLDYRPLFVTVSGAHLYGFPSADSDVDLRGCHQLPLRDVVGLDLPNQTLEHKTVHDGTEVELVSHEVGKYLRLLVRNNGYILEQIFSPIVVLGQEFLDELRPLARRCITRHHYHHYRGFYATQRKLIAKEEPKRAKPVLYAYRVLMTGIHLLRTGEVEANLLRLNEHFGFDVPRRADRPEGRRREHVGRRSGLVVPRGPAGGVGGPARPGIRGVAVAGGTGATGWSTSFSWGSGWALVAQIVRRSG